MQRKREEEEKEEGEHDEDEAENQKRPITPASEIQKDAFELEREIESEHNRYDKYQRWSPRDCPWPRGHILKFLALASKPQVHKIAQSSARGQHYFLSC